MDKTEYKIRAEEIKSLIRSQRYADAVKIADTIDWKRVKSVGMLCAISDLYKVNRRLEESRDILLLAYDRSPTRREIVYSLCELAIAMGEFVQAVEYYKEFVRLAPRNTARYILQYKLYEAQDVSLEERIAVLEEYKKHDYNEKWAYELAYLYHRVGLTTECIEECDELFLYMREGRFVMKALELKSLHEPLSPEQKAVYAKYKAEISGNIHAPVLQEPVPGKDMVDDKKAPTRELPVISEEMLQYQNAQNAAENYADGQAYGQTSYEQQTYEQAPYGQPGFEQQAYEQTGYEQPAYEQSAYGQSLYGQPAYEGQPARDESSYTGETSDSQLIFENQVRESQVMAEQSYLEPEDEDIPEDNVSQDTIVYETPAENDVPADDELPIEETYKVPTVNVDTYNTVDLQKEIAENLKEVLTQSPEAALFADAHGPQVIREGDETESLDTGDMFDTTDTTGDIARPSMSELFFEDKVEDKKEELAAEPEQEEEPISEAREPEKKAWEPEAVTDTKVWNTSSMKEIKQQISEENSPKTPISEEFKDKEIASNIAQTTMNDHTMYKGVVFVDEPLQDEVPGAVIKPNSRYQINNHFDKMLSQDYDGQISLAIDEAKQVEQQITGQISINDYINDWEKFKKSQQEKQYQSVKKHVASETGELFKDFDQNLLNPLLKGEVEPEEAPAVKDVIAPMGETGEEVPESYSFAEDTVPAEDISEEPVQEAVYDEPVEEAVAYDKQELFAKTSDKPGVSDDYLPEEISEEVPAVDEQASQIPVEETAETEPVGVQEVFAKEDSSEITYVDDLQNTRSMVELTGEEFERALEETDAEEALKEELKASAEDGNYDLPADEEIVSESLEEVIKEAAEVDLGETTTIESAKINEEIEKTEQAKETSEPVEAADEEELPQTQEVPKSDESDVIAEPENISEPVAAKADPEKADEVKAEPQKTDEVKAETKKPVQPASNNDETEDEKEDKGIEERVRVMTPEEKALFGPYIHYKKSRRQIIRAIDNLSMAAYTNNAIVTGEQGAGTVNLAKGLIKAVQSTDSNFSGKVAMITAIKLNKSSVSSILDKIVNGALIIRRAADLKEDTVATLLKQLQSENKGYIVVIEDTRDDIDRLLDKYPDLKKCFNVRVDIEALDDDSLVAYAEQYALEKEHVIDNLGILALHQKISERQTLDHEVTVTEVKEMVDDAIYYADKYSIGHYFDVLLRKRYDNEDMIILREKDFLH